MISKGSSASFTINGKVNKHFDKTTIIMCGNWLDNIINHCNFKVLNNNQNLKYTRYLMYILNQVVPVLVDIERMTITGENVKFFFSDKISRFAILRDDVGNLIYVELSTN